MPSVSSDTADCVSKYSVFTDAEAPPPNLSQIAGRASDLRRLQQTASKAREHPTKDRLVALLAAAFHAGMIAGAVLGTYFLLSNSYANIYPGALAASAVTITLGGITAHCVLSVLYARKWPMTDKRTCADGEALRGLIMFPFLTTAIPLVMGLNKEGRYRSAAIKLEGSLKEEWFKVKMFFESEKYSQLQGSMATRIASLQSQISSASEEGLGEAVGTKAYANEKAQLERQSTELETAKTYFTDKYQFYKLKFDEELGRFVRDE
ncbi:MAG: hypothetical protein K1000chlam4_01007 [Chlamydiae bacterium]|nr:hypothetical protein [Chlamydiota bacterium]